MNIPFVLPSPHVEKFAGQESVLQIWPRENADCILFYPGSLLEPGHYLLFINSLYSMGFAVAGIHLPGHGLARAGKEMFFQNFLEEGIFAEKWLENNGFGQVAVCGHSQGGILAMAHAASSSTASGAFSICSVFPQMDEAISLTLFKNFARYRVNLLAAIRRASETMPNLPIPLPCYLSLRKLLHGRQKPVIMGNGKGRISYPLKYLASLFDAGISPLLRCPWTLFSAIDDALFTSDLTLAVFKRAIAPQKTLVWLPCGGHMAILNPCISAFTAGHIASACAGMGMRINARKSHASKKAE